MATQLTYTTNSTPNPLQVDGIDSTLEVIASYSSGQAAAFISSLDLLHKS